MLRGDTAGDIVCCYETPNNPRGISTMADAVDADDLVQSIPSVPLTASRIPETALRLVLAATLIVVATKMITEMMLITVPIISEYGL